MAMELMEFEAGHRRTTRRVSHASASEVKTTPPPGVIEIAGDELAAERSGSDPGATCDGSET